MKTMTLGVAFVLAALGCASGPDPAERTDPDALTAASAESLARALADARRAQTAGDWLAAWAAWDKAAALDGARAHEAEIAQGRLAVGKAIAIDGARIEFWGLLPDRQRGIDYLLATARQHRHGDVAPQALFYAAQASRLIGEPDLAQLYLDQLVGTYGETDWAEAAEYERVLALLQAARTLEHDLGPLEECAWRLPIYLDVYPRGRNREAAKATLEAVRENLAERDYRTGRWYERDGKPDGARVYYREVTRRFPASPWAEEAAARLARLPAPAAPWPPADAPGASPSGSGP